TDGHAFRLDSNLHFPDPGALLQIDDRDSVVVLVGHIQNSAGRILSKQLRVRARRQRSDNLIGVTIDDLNGIVVADGHQNELSILAQFDTARSLPDLDCVYDRELVDINDTDRIALLVRNIGKKCVGRCVHEDKQADSEQASPTNYPASRFQLQLTLHLVSGRSTPSVSNSDT